MVYKVRGFLKRILDERMIGKEGTRPVRDIVIILNGSERFPQIRKFQAIDAMVKKLDTIPVNSEVEIEFVLKGREFTSKKSLALEYYNIDEITSIYEIK